MSIRVLGIDPGSRKTGYGIVEHSGSSIRHVDNGVIVADVKETMPMRLRQIYEGLVDVIQEYKPDRVAVETVFMGKNVASALKLGQARGVALLAAARANLPFKEFSPMEVKRAVTGTGRADKHQVQEMVRMILGLPEVPQEDAADALAVAICRCMHKEFPLPLPQKKTTRRRKK